MVSRKKAPFSQELNTIVVQRAGEINFRLAERLKNG